jgi:hypothetical protein
MSNEVKVLRCRLEFWMMLEDALERAGAGSGLVDRLADKPLREVVDTLAQNGIRMTFKPEWHMNPEIRGGGHYE